MRVYLLPKDFKGQDSITLKGKDYNYIVNVLRLKSGQAFTGRDIDGQAWDLRIDSIANNCCTVICKPASRAESTTDTLPQDRPTRNIILYQCLPKGRKADDIVKKATEIGARTIVLVKSKNCVADLSGKENSRVERYNSVVKEAIQQSGSMIPTTVEGVIDISDVPADFAGRCKALNQNGLGIFLHQCKIKEDQTNLAESVKYFDGTIGIVVGSEGGFTDAECDALLASDFKAVLLKTNILRCETAAIYALAAVQTLVETSCS